MFDGRDCLGHIIHRGPDGFEAYDLNDRSLGRYPTMREAADALSAQPDASGK